MKIWYLCVVFAVLVAHRVVQGRRSLLSKRKAKKHSDLTPFASDGGLEDGVQDKVGISETDVNGMLRNGDIAFIEMKDKKKFSKKSKNFKKKVKMEVKENRGDLKDA